MLFEQKSRRGTDGVLFFWALPFFHLQKLEVFYLLKGVAHRRCALRISANHLGELVLIDGWH